MTDLILFWHRRDLRLSDNVALAAAREHTSKVVGVFCLDPSILERDDVAPARVTYMVGCLAALQEAYARTGSELLILKGNPVQAIPALAAALSAQAVFWNWDVEPYAQARDEQVRHALKERGIGLHTSWDQLLHAPGEIRTNAGDPYTVYTPFWKNWQKQPKAAPLPTLSDVQGLSDSEREAATAAGAIALPSAQDLGFGWDGDLVLAPGEAAARDRLEAFCESSTREGLWVYDDQRDFPAEPGTSQLSAALKFGAIGIRTVWAAADAALSRSRSEESTNNIRTWQQELAWREFYQHAMYFFPRLAEGPYRREWQDFPWENREDRFQAWCEGRTGYPIVDAAMRQLNEIGWMHNRCRMIVASFLVKDLIIDWRWGEKYFMQKLVDGDLSANNGGWQWSASSGMDPKPLRIFNPASQAQKYDPDAVYIRQWLPELKSLDAADLVSGKILPLVRDRCGYPAPIVDHKVQQQKFKDLYKQQKAQG